MLTSDARPFEWAKTPTDTAGTSIPVARLRIAGAPGAAITLGLDDTSATATKESSTTDLIAVRVASREQRYSLADITRGVTVHQFATYDTVAIEYRIIRGTSTTPSATSKLVQVLSLGATVVDAQRTWIRNTSSSKFLATGTTCAVGEPGLICSDVESTVGMTPYYVNFDGFSSTPCCGQTVQLTITFNIPMSSVTVTAADPDFPGNTITAFDANGTQIDQQSFVGDNTPGTLTFDPRTVSGEGIRSVVLDAPIGDYVYYLPIQVVVGSAAPPTITSISPNPLVPGFNATIVGTGFSATTASNVVSIGGQQAKVSSATATQLSVVVPCTSSGTIDVTVSKSGQSSTPFQHPLQVAQQTLAVGQSVVLPSATASACNELPSAGGPARYILAVVNANTDLINADALQLSAERRAAPTPINGALRAAAAIRSGSTPAMALHPPDKTGFDIGEQSVPTQRRAHLAFLRRDTEIADRFYAGQFNGRSPSVLSSAAPPSTPLATRSFRIPDTRPGSSVCNNFWQTTGTRVYYNGKIAIYEDTATPAAFKAQLNTTMATYYAHLGNQFNTQMEPIVRDHFGDILLRDAQMDNNGVMVVLFTPLVAQQNARLQAFVVSCDQRAPDDKTKRKDGGPYVGSVLNGNGASNFGEYVYATLPTVPGPGFAQGTVDSWYRTIRSTIIHESKHIASYSARTKGGWMQERPWLNEGTAMIAEELWMRLAVDQVPWKGSIGFGSATTPINIYCDVQTTSPCASGLRIIMFDHFSKLHSSLSNPGTISPLGKTPLDTQDGWYAESWSLIRYAIDRYATSEKNFLAPLTAGSDTGVTNLELRAGVKLETLLAGRSLSMYAEQYPGLASAGADIRFPTWNLRDIYSYLNGINTYPTPGQPFPLVPTQITFGSPITTAVISLLGGTSAWYELSGTQSASQLLRLEGSAGAQLPPGLRLSIARLQ